MNDDPKREVMIFTEALSFFGADRAAYLDRACGGDEKLHGKVKALLKAHDRAGTFLEELPSRGTFEKARRSSGLEKPGDRIGRYKLLQQIGEGGWGVVFMAEQEEPIRRRVALKIVKPGMDTKSVIARFEAERQALALMDHPNIAHVYDAGATANGRPYFVMELVRGVKVTDYCDQRSLSTAARLELFMEICEAVQHAHQKGIIHRDIKPSNILVTTTGDGKPLPKVIDFGIAKATTNQRLTDKTLFTAFEMLIGTPAYMSPEQAALTSVEVDTRTDIYSLGVLLYELVTGTTPFDARELLKAGVDEVRRVIQNEEPVRPSTRLSTMVASELTTLSRNRQVEPPKLIREVRGDLDWIVMKALEKDPSRRYATANGLAADVKCYSAEEPISARPPSNLYRFQKTVLRNKLLFIGIGVIAMLLVLSLIIVSASLAKQRQARRETVTALRQAESDKRVAQTEAAKSQQVTRFLEDMLQGVGPSVARGRDTTMLREILDRTAERVGNEMTNQPPVEAELRSLIGRLYLQIGNYDGAEKMHRAALAINRKLYGPESAEVAASLNDLGLALRKEGKLAEAESAHQEALGIRQRLFGPESAAAAASLNDLATVFRHQGRREEAEALIRQALGIRRKISGDDNLDVADMLHNLSVVLGDEGKRAEAEATAREMLAMRRRLLGNEDPLVASALADLAWAATGSGKLDEAESLERDALAMQRKLLGDEAPDVAKSLDFLGQLLARRGSLQESHTVLQAALSIQRKLLGEDNPESLDTMRSLGLVLESEDKLAESETVHRAALALWRKRGQGEIPPALSEFESLVRVLVRQRKFGEAEALLDDRLTPAFAKEASSASLLVTRAELRARQSRWQEAAADASLSFQHDPQVPSRYPLIAALLIKSHDRPAYQEFCKEILARFARTTNVFIADQVAKACLFRPSPQLDLHAASHLADSVVTHGVEYDWAMPFFSIGKALSEYRQGRHADAAEWARKAIASSNASAHAHAYAILAMANWRLGQTTAAREALAKGEGLAPETLPPNVADDPSDAWQVWLYARVSLDEASELIPHAQPN